MFEKAIEIILSQPPEPHYPAYYADLLKKADVPDKDVGECSEIPNSSDTIYRQAAFDALRTCYDTETISMDNGDEYINYGDAVGEIEQLPSAKPELPWILVSEQLPENDCQCIVTAKVKHVDNYPDYEIDTADFADGIFTTDNVWWGVESVVAWMPLPKPWREDGEKE